MPHHSRGSKRRSKGASIESPNHLNSTNNVMETERQGVGTTDNHKVSANHNNSPGTDYRILINFFDMQQTWGETRLYIQFLVYNCMERDSWETKHGWNNQRANHAGNVHETWIRVNGLNRVQWWAFIPLCESSLSGEIRIFLGVSDSWFTWRQRNQDCSYRLAWSTLTVRHPVVMHEQRTQQTRQSLWLLRLPDIKYV
jgi:hypothetical protein